jgi:hypothetical protein
LPRPGVPNNASGENGVYSSPAGVHGYVEAPQGTIQRLTQSTQAAPLAGRGPAAHALDTARRSQRTATRPAPVPAEPQMVALPPRDQIQPQAVAAQVWQELAADPAIAQYPLLAEYAKRAGGSLAQS